MSARSAIPSTSAWCAASAGRSADGPDAVDELHAGVDRPTDRGAGVAPAAELVGPVAPGHHGAGRLPLGGDVPELTLAGRPRRSAARPTSVGVGVGVGSHGVGGGGDNVVERQGQLTWGCPRQGVLAGRLGPLAGRLGRLAGPIGLSAAGPVHRRGDHRRRDDRPVGHTVEQLGPRAPPVVQSSGAVGRRAGGEGLGPGCGARVLVEPPLPGRPAASPGPRSATAAARSAAEQSRPGRRDRLTTRWSRARVVAT